MHMQGKGNVLKGKYYSPEATLVELTTNIYFLTSGFEETAEIDDRSGESWWEK